MVISDMTVPLCGILTDPSWHRGAVGGGHIVKAVWDDQFASDKDARNTAIQAIEAEGAIAFMRGDNVIRFRKT